MEDLAENRLAELGIRLINREKDPYKCMIGRAVRVVSQGPDYAGFYRGMTEEGDIILFPYMESESWTEADEKNKEEKRMIHFWQEEVPAFVNNKSVLSIVSIRKDYLESIIKGGLVMPKPGMFR